MATDYQITVPLGVSDQSLVQVLNKILPGILVHKFKYRREYAESMARMLAPKMVEHARACGQQQLLKDRPNTILLMAPTAEQCASLAKDMDEIVRIRFTDHNLHPQQGKLKYIAGKLWSFIVSDEREREIWEREEQTLGSGGGGTRA